MRTIEYTTMDRSDWGEGAWQDEPDKKQWQDKDTKLPCIAVRNRTGNWCGYVGITEEHPCYKQGYNDVLEVEVHGGLTFSDSCRKDGPQESSICHIPEGEETDKIWWLGFDCSHYNDISPKLLAFEKEFMLPEAEYRTLIYIEAECKKLARSLQELA